MYTATIEPICSAPIDPERSTWVSSPVDMAAVRRADEKNDVEQRRLVPLAIYHINCKSTVIVYLVCKKTYIYVKTTTLENPAEYNCQIVQVAGVRGCYKRQEAQCPHIVRMIMLLGGGRPKLLRSSEPLGQPRRAGRVRASRDHDENAENLQISIWLISRHIWHIRTHKTLTSAGSWPPRRKQP